MSIDTITLPNEILLKIFEENSIDLFVVEQVCKHWQAVVRMSYSSISHRLISGPEGELKLVVSSCNTQVLTEKEILAVKESIKQLRRRSTEAFDTLYSVDIEKAKEQIATIVKGAIFLPDLNVEKTANALLKIRHFVTTQFDIKTLFNFNTLCVCYFVRDFMLRYQSINKKELSEIGEDETESVLDQCEKFLNWRRLTPAKDGSFEVVLRSEEDQAKYITTLYGIQGDSITYYSMSDARKIQLIAHSPGLVSWTTYEVVLPEDMHCMFEKYLPPEFNLLNK